MDISNIYARKNIGNSPLAASVEAANRGRVYNNAVNAMVPFENQIQLAIGQDQLEAKRVAEYEGRQGWGDATFAVGAAANRIVADHTAGHEAKVPKLVLPADFNTWTPEQQSGYLLQKGRLQVPETWGTMSPQDRMDYTKRVFGLSMMGPPAPAPKGNDLLPGATKAYGQALMGVRPEQNPLLPGATKAEGMALMGAHPGKPGYAGPTLPPNPVANVQGATNAEIRQQTIPGGDINPTTPSPPAGWSEMSAEERMNYMNRKKQGWTIPMPPPKLVPGTIEEKEAADRRPAVTAPPSETAPQMQGGFGPWSPLPGVIGQETPAPGAAAPVAPPSETAPQMQGGFGPWSPLPGIIGQETPAPETRSSEWNQHMRETRTLLESMNKLKQAYERAAGNPQEQQRIMKEMEPQFDRLQRLQEERIRLQRRLHGEDGVAPAPGAGSAGLTSAWDDIRKSVEEGGTGQGTAPITMPTITVTPESETVAPGAGSAGLTSAWDDIRNPVGAGGAGLTSAWSDIRGSLVEELGALEEELEGTIPDTPAQTSALDQIEKKVLELESVEKQIQQEIEQQEQEVIDVAQFRKELVDDISWGEGGFHAKPFADPERGTNVGFGRSITENGMDVQTEIIPFLKENKLSDAQIAERLKSAGISRTKAGKVKLTADKFNKLFPEGLTEKQGSALADADIDMFQHQVENLVGRDVWRKMDNHRRNVLVEMMYTMGAKNMSSFRRMISALKAGDYEKAALEMQWADADKETPGSETDWFKQVGKARALPMIYKMRHGQSIITPRAPRGKHPGDTSATTTSRSLIDRLRGKPGVPETTTPKTPAPATRKETEPTLPGMAPTTPEAMPEATSETMPEVTPEATPETTVTTPEVAPEAVTPAPMAPPQRPFNPPEGYMSIGTSPGTPGASQAHARTLVGEEAWQRMGDTRRRVLSEFINTSSPEFRESPLFRRMMLAIKHGNYQQAAEAMRRRSFFGPSDREGDWYPQVGKEKGDRMMYEMQHGQPPTPAPVTPTPVTPTPVTPAPVPTPETAWTGGQTPAQPIPMEQRTNTIPTSLHDSLPKQTIDQLKETAKTPPTHAEIAEFQKVMPQSAAAVLAPNSMFAKYAMEPYLFQTIQQAAALYGNDVEFAAMINRINQALA